MATLIICPVCDTRYETAAVFPPEGRKVRCSKCSHVWQAVAVTLQPAAAGAPAAPAAPAAKPAAPPQPKPAAPVAPQPNVAAAPRAAQPAPRSAAQSPGLTGFTGLQTPQPQPSAMPKPPPPPPAPPQASRGDADFDTGGDVAVEATSYNSDAWVGGEDSPAEKSKSGGLFGRFTTKKAATPAPAAQPGTSAPQPGTFEAALAEAYKADKGGTGDAGLEADGDASLGVPDLDAPPPPPKKKARRRFSPVTIGWAALAAIVALVLGTLLFAPSTVVSVVPGAARLYSLFGMPVGAHGLAFEGVRYGWTNEGGQMVLEVQGDVVNNSGTKVEVPTVVIALRDESGEEISEWTTEVSETELDAGEHAPFLRQIPSPPSNVRSVKVRFAKVAE